MSLEQGCRALGVNERTIRRWGSESEMPQRSGNPCPHNALTEAEKTALEAVCRQKELADHSVRALSFHLLEQQDTYISHVTINRHLQAKGVRGSRKRGRRRPRDGGKPDVSFAQGPNELWCWDVTWLRRDTPWKHFYAYVIEDYVSRKIVGGRVEEALHSRLATELWDEAILAEGLIEEPRACWPASLSDRGGQMKSRHTRHYFGASGILQFFSRPRTPDDNAWIEALFSTMKTRLDYPGYFSTLAEAREWLAAFVKWYNNEHHHSSLGYVTPDQRHRGVHEEILAARKAKIAACLATRKEANSQLRSRTA